MLLDKTSHCRDSNFCSSIWRVFKNSSADTWKSLKVKTNYYNLAFSKTVNTLYISTLNFYQVVIIFFFNVGPTNFVWSPSMIYFHLGQLGVSHQIDRINSIHSNSKSLPVKTFSNILKVCTSSYHQMMSYQELQTISAHTSRNNVTMTILAFE